MVPPLVHKLLVEKSGHKLVNTDPFHPAFLLRIAMQGQPGAATNYRMTEDFTTGELHVRWSDDQGDWCRKLFVSRPDDVVVLSISGPEGKLDCELALEVEHPQVKSELAVEDRHTAMSFESPHRVRSRRPAELPQTHPEERPTGPRRNQHSVVPNSVAEVAKTSGE